MYELIMRLGRDEKYVKEKYKILKNQKNVIDLSSSSFYIEPSDLRGFTGIMIYVTI